MTLTVINLSRVVLQAIKTLSLCICNPYACMKWTESCILYIHSNFFVRFRIRRTEKFAPISQVNIEKTAFEISTGAPERVVLLVLNLIRQYQLVPLLQ